MKKDYILFVAIMILVIVNLVLSRTGGDSTVVKAILIVGILVITGVFVISNFIESRREKKAKRAEIREKIKKSKQCEKK